MRIAADTNVLIDFADEVESVLDAFATIEQRLPNSEFFVTPSVLDELAYFCDLDRNLPVTKSARRAMEQLARENRFRPLLDLPVSLQVIENIAKEIRLEELLPAEEIHDSRILAESSLVNCAILLTSDQHLRSIDHETMALFFSKFDLSPPVIATPREIVRKFFR